jgi:Family of unknown function (DUF5719)
VSSWSAGRRGQALSAVAVVAGLAAAYGVGSLSHPATLGSSAQTGQPSRVMVSSATRACAAPGSTGSTAASVATAAMPDTTSTTSVRNAASAAAAGNGSASSHSAVSGSASNGSASNGSASNGSASSVVISRLSEAGSTATGTVLHTLTKPGVLNWSAITAAPQQSIKIPATKTPATKIPATKTPGTKTPATKTQGAKAPGTKTQGTNATASDGTAVGGAGSTTGTSAAAAATKPGRGGIVVQATGAMAQGLAVEQSGPGGLITGQCPAPGTDFWFVGPGATSAAQIDLYLMNTDSSPAEVQVDALTDSGPPLGSADSGIVVPPHGMVVQSVGQLLKASRVVALHVTTSSGRVAASVRETRAAADDGVWLPAAQTPAKQLVIPGVPGSAGTRELYIAVPGTGNAQIKVTAVTAKGSYQPTGGSGIDLAGDSAVSVELPSLSSVAGAIKVTSTVPVTASILVPGGASGAPGAISAAAAPVTEQGLVAASPAGSAGSADLVISAPGKAATVSIVAATSKISFAGQTAQVVHIAAGHSVVRRIKPPHGGKTSDFSVVVTPQAGSGPVYVGRVISASGVVRTILPVISALTWVPLPPTQDSLSVIGAKG